MQLNQRGSNLVMVSALITALLATAVALEVTISRGIKAQIVKATVDMLGLPPGTGEGYESGDGHETQRFGASSSEELLGFLDDPAVIATGNRSNTSNASDAFRGGTVTYDSTINSTESSVQVSRELMPDPGAATADDDPSEDPRHNGKPWPRRYDEPRWDDD